MNLFVNLLNLLTDWLDEHPFLSWTLKWSFILTVFTLWDLLVYWVRGQ